MNKSRPPRWPESWGGRTWRGSDCLGKSAIGEDAWALTEETLLALYRAVPDAKAMCEALGVPAFNALRAQRALQWLRRAGLIAFKGGAWTRAAGRSATFRALSKWDREVLVLVYAGAERTALQLAEALESVPGGEPAARRGFAMVYLVRLEDRGLVQRWRQWFDVPTGPKYQYVWACTDAGRALAESLGGAP